DYLLQNKKSVEIGPATLCDKSGNTCKSPAIGQTFSLVYQVYIISTGRRVTGEGKIDDNLKLSLFQVDGQGGLRNGTAGANYNLFITGLNRIRTMACVPTVSISPSEINFGDIPAGNARPGYYEKTRPFTVTYGLVKQGNGSDCGTEPMLATFSTTNTIQESAIILPQPDSGFGIAISPNASMHPLIEMNAPIHFTLATGATLASTYTAGLLWLSRTPKLGPFSATAKITVTFE
ncbi:TPA: fimbrial protein, partial [Klebsiella pneumoniae]|nr:fimbrial protein [Klebsiella pneumoniae]